MFGYRFFMLVTVMIALLCEQTHSSSVQLASNNMEDILQSNELVFVNFYADWCRFSQMLKPVFDEAAEKIAKQFPETGKVVFGKVDCDRETGIASQYHVSKYPTLKLFRGGALVKREYRGQRSADALAKFVADQLILAVETVEDLEHLDSLDRKKRHLIGYFDSEESPDFLVFKNMASQLRDDCRFRAAFGSVADPERVSGNKMVFRPSGESPSDVLYTGPLHNQNLVQQWAQDKCVPLVREITFENAEELTEEGLPFMILFHNADDTETPEAYRRVVSKELLPDKSNVNFLTADGSKFTHPLYHLGKSANDLPILSIDSFRHMYLWKGNAKTDLEQPGLLKQFIADLHSGKLHREFHHGPDLAKDTPAPGEDGAVATVAADGKKDNVIHFDVQQQLIMHNDGVQVQVVRFVQLGRQQPVDLREHLEKLGEEVNANVAEALGNQTDETKDAEGDDSQKEAINLDGLAAPKIELDTGEEEKPAANVHVPRDDPVEIKEEKPEVPDSAQDSNLGNPEMKQTQVSEEDKQTQVKDMSNEKDVKDTPNQWNQHRQERHHQMHHQHRSKPETTTRSITKVTQVKMKLINDQEDMRKHEMPPESIFRRLAPSESRYTILRPKDEL